MNQYETVFILTPRLSEDQVKEAVSKFRKILKDFAARIIHEESWVRETSGHYHLFEYEAGGAMLADLELAFKRDERVLRFMTVRLDKGALRGDAPARFDEWRAAQEDAGATA